MSMRVLMHEGNGYVNIEDYLNHLEEAVGTVKMMTEGINAPNAQAVIQTLQTSIEFLETLS